MESNPYYDIATLLRPTSETKDWMLAEGKVISTSPLQVAVFEHSFGGDDLQVNAQLLGGWSQQVRIEQPMTSIEGKLTAQGPALRPGDRVLVLTADRQTLYILCKVVSA